MPAKLISLEWAIAQSFDEVSKHIVVLQHTEHRVHGGGLYLGEYSASVADTNSMELLITTGSKFPHMSFAIAAGGQVTVYFYESTSKTGGTEITTRNFNRNHSDNNGVTVAHTPSGSGDGVALIDGRLIPGGAGAAPQSRVGGDARSGTELVLKPNTKYLLRVTNTSGGTIDINPVLNYYER